MTGSCVLRDPADPITAKAVCLVKWPELILLD